MEKNRDVHTKNYFLKLKSVNPNFYPLIITISFFLIFSYVAFFNHNFWSEEDGTYYLQSGEQILNGEGRGVHF